MYPTLVKIAATITGASALSLAGIVLYCSKKQAQLDATIAESRARMMADALKIAGWQDTKTHV